MKPTQTLKADIQKLFINFRIMCDYALSDRNEEVRTQAEYEKAIKWELNYATQAILALIEERVVEAQVDEWERIDLGIAVTPHYISQRIKRLKAQPTPSGKPKKNKNEN